MQFHPRHLEPLSGIVTAGEPVSSPHFRGPQTRQAGALFPAPVRLSAVTGLPAFAIGSHALMLSDRRLEALS